MNALYCIFSPCIICSEVSSFAFDGWYSPPTTERSFEPGFPESHCFTRFLKHSSHRIACMVSVRFHFSVSVSACKSKTKKPVGWNERTLGIDASSSIWSSEYKSLFGAEEREREGGQEARRNNICDRWA